MKKAKSVLSLLLAFLMLFNLTVLTSAEGTPTLSVTADVTEFNQGAEAAKVVYTVKLNPNGTNVAAFQFTLTAPEGMTLAQTKTSTQGADGYWTNTKLRYDEDYNTEGIFGTFTYTPTTGYFGASGGIAGRTLDSETTIMTITATVDTSAAKTYTLGVSGFICYAVGSTSLGGDTPTVDTITVKASTVAVNGVTLDKPALSLDLKNNKTGTLTATVAPSNATDKTVTWTSSDDSVATVANGVVTAVAAGTATITAKAGDKTAQCTVTVVNCLHTYGKTTTEAKDSNCKVQGWDKYSACNVCGQKFDASGAEIAEIPYRDLAAHNFTGKVMNDSTLKTPGNCTTKAVHYYSCTVCGVKGETTFESEFGAHDLTKTEAKDATCTEAGNNEYWTCGTCHKVFKADKATETTVAAETIAAHHTLTKVDGKAATCTLTGEKERWHCSVCDKNFSDKNGTVELTDITTPAKGHTYGDLIPATSATCVEQGMSAHYQCTVCHAYFDEGKNSVGESNLKIDINPNNHAVALTKTDANDATCTAAGNNEYYTCSRCNKVFKDEVGNTVTTVDAEKIDALGHTMTKTEAVAPTCTEAGTLAYWTCSNVCCDGIKFGDEEGTTRLDSIVDPAKGHSYGTLIAEAPSTCTKPGMAAHYYCAACQTYFRADADKTSVPNEAALELPLAPHTFDKYVTVVEGSETKIGVDQCLCSVCNEPGEYTAYLKLPATLHIVKGANSTGNPPAGVKFAFVVGDGNREFPATTGAATEDLVNAQSIGVGGKTQDEAIRNLISTLTTTEEWIVKQTTASGNGWTVDATEYTVTFEVDDENTVSVNITAPVTVTVTEKNEDGSEKTTTKTEVKEFEKIEFTNTYVSTTPVRPNHRPSGGSSATSSDKVQSSKTFDAGIAAYVGLSVLSLTGSALVIGKKKEF